MRRAAVLLLLVVAACSGPTAAQRARSTLATSLAAADKAADAFVKWDGAEQLAIIDREADPGGWVLETHRRNARKVDALFVTAYTAIAAGAAMVPLVESGRRTYFELLLQLEEAARALIDAQREFSTMRAP